MDLPRKQINNCFWVFHQCQLRKHLIRAASEIPKSIKVGFFFPPRLITDNSTLLWVLFLVNKVVALPRLCTNFPRHCLHVKTLVCLHSPPILPVFASPFLHIKYLSAPLHLLKVRELGEETEEWSVSPPLHFYDQRCLSGLQPTDLGTRHFWTGAICHCHPQGRAASWGWGFTLVWRRIWVYECECISVWAHHSELLCMVLHIN